MLDWNRLRVFHAVAEAGSFTEAGKRLNLSQSAVSRQIAALEEQLGISLFQRHARGLVMTEQGQTLYQTAQELVTKLTVTETLLKDNKSAPSGRLHVNATVGFGTLWLTPRMVRFQELFPEIDIMFTISDYGVDLTRAAADVMISVRPPDQVGLIQRHLVTWGVYLYASPAYLEKYGELKKAVDLDNHHLICYHSSSGLAYPEMNWILTAGRDESSPRKPRFSANNIITMARAVESGVGIAALPDYFEQTFPELKRVLPDLSGRPVPAYFVYPESLKLSRKVGVFRDFLLEEAKKLK
ncbi:MAG: LysR family transcriptional regulator [Dongiaceae bacterium]